MSTISRPKFFVHKASTNMAGGDPTSWAIIGKAYITHCLPSLGPPASMNASPWPLRAQTHVYPPYGSVLVSENMFFPSLPSAVERENPLISTVFLQKVLSPLPKVNLGPNLALSFSSHTGGNPNLLVGTEPVLAEV